MEARTTALTVGAQRHPLLDRPALTPTLTVRLGVKRQSGNRDFPKEVDYFVLKPEDGATDEVRQLYGEAPKSLWVMLPYEAPIPGNPQPEDDLSVSVYNMAWGWNAGLLCKGTGKDRHQPGWAETDNEAFANRIAQVIQARVEQSPETGRYRIPCLGQDCPKYLQKVVTRKQGGGWDDQLAPGHDPDAMCRLQVRFEALLLDPAVERNLSEPPRILAVMKMASGSINSVRGLIDGLSLMRAMTVVPGAYPQGRTAMLPLKLIRKNTSTTHGVRAMHFTLAIEPTPSVWHRWLRVRPSGMFLAPAQLQEIRQLLAAEISFDEVQDIVPRPALEQHNPLREEVQGRGPAVPQGRADPDDAIADAETPPPPEPVGEEPPDEPATPAQIRALKDLLGGREDPDDPQSPATPETNANVRRWLAQWYQTFGVQPPERFRYRDITARQVQWITERVGEEIDEGFDAQERAREQQQPADPPDDQGADDGQPGLFDGGQS